MLAARTLSVPRNRCGNPSRNRCGNPSLGEDYGGEDPRPAHLDHLSLPTRLVLALGGGFQVALLAGLGLGGGGGVGCGFFRRLGLDRRLFLGCGCGFFRRLLIVADGLLIHPQHLADLPGRQPLLAQLGDGLAAVGNLHPGPSHSPRRARARMRKSARSALRSIAESSSRGTFGLPTFASPSSSPIRASIRPLTSYALLEVPDRWTVFRPETRFVVAV